MRNTTYFLSGYKELFLMFLFLFRLIQHSRTGTSSNDYFETVIENKLGVPKKEQHQGLKVSKEVLFQLTIDLCRYFNERFKAERRDSLRLAINWLSDMEQNPKDHQEEWAIWNEMVVAVTEHGKKSMGSF